MILSAEEKVRCINDAIAAADVAEEKFYKMWSGISQSLQKKTSKKYSTPMSPSKNYEVRSLKEIHLPISTVPNKTEAVQHFHGTMEKGLKCRNKEKKMHLKTTIYCRVQPFKLRKKIGDKAMKVFGFGGYAVLPRFEKKRLLVPSAIKVPGWRTLDRLTMRDNKIKECEGDKRNNNNGDKSNISVKENISCLRRSKPKFGLSDISLASWPRGHCSAFYCHNRSVVIVSSSHKNLLFTMGDKIEMLLSKVRKMKRSTSKEKNETLERSCSFRETCPAQHLSLTTRSLCYDPSSKWSSPRQAVCTCFPRTYSAAVFERTSSLKSFPRI